MVDANRNAYDVSFIFGEAPVCPRGRALAEKLRTLLERFSHIKQGCCGRRRPEVYVPETGYLTDTGARKRAAAAFLNTDYIFVVVTDQLSADLGLVDRIQECYREAIYAKKSQRRLIPIFASPYQSPRSILSELVPFGLENVVGVNVTELGAPGGHRTLAEMDARRVRAREVDAMCMGKFTALLNNSFTLHETRRRPVSEETRRRRQALHQFAQEKLAEMRTNGIAHRLSRTKAAIQ